MSEREPAWQPGTGGLMGLPWTAGIGEAPDPRARLLDIATATVGLSFSEPTRERYVAALFDDEPAVRGYSMAQAMSSCALLVRACWRKFGLTDRRLVAPYVPGQVFSDLVAMAREAGAWRAPGLIDSVEPGDCIMVTGPEHVLIVESTSSEDDGGVDVITSIDGGQRDELNSWAIKRRVRRVGAGPSLVSADGSGRSVLGWIDWSAVAAKFGG